MKNHEVFMKRCLELASAGQGNVAPNPMVGAVLVHHDSIIGEGCHEVYGQTHAEINCLDSVKDEHRHLISESTMYVSLEPCAHFGKTPPCALRLAKEKVKEVIVCNEDPFEKVSGRGFTILHEHHIATESGILKDHGLWVNRRFFCFHQQKRPYIILKWAQTQQGFFAPLNRTRFQMSNRHSQQLVHKWRTEEAAILVGTKTALHDDPQLTARHWNGRQPLRIVIDRSLSLPPSLRLFDGEAPVWVVNGKKDGDDKNLKYVALDFAADVLQQLLQRLYQANILSLIAEGGAALLSSFIREGLWDEARIFETENVLQEGIPAPLLHEANKAFSTSIGSDSLHVYVRESSPYQYVKEMEL
jgi:diaminohydroxyphosphoribosylaminopyrimidine deaminase/5-amino-6-(5-phosphoribosylamino)uracil reductase